MTERQRFEVVENFDEFQLRRYEPCTLAEVNIGDSYSAAASEAFRPLFSYISRGNSQSQSISMTAPVIASTKSDLSSHEWSISFVMPAGSRLEDMPIPNESRVVLREMPTEICVALSFRGRATQQLCETKEKELRELAEKNKIELSDETRICRFDPPFKPGFLMYNEIVIPLKNN
jgi:hypothetical protein